ncbi:MAG: phosphoribosylaminoimidazole-succinocarboxamide synthase [Candidatus Deianiraeaceae bacterium]|jgi:phosphoribosylaminoimidazole-succinocarboxamide synthase
MKQIYEGKAKILFEESGDIIQYFKDDTTAFNNQKFAISDGKGVLNNAISAYFMNKIEYSGVKTHFINKIDDRHQRVKFVEIIPLEVIVRNISAGSFCKKFGVTRGLNLTKPLVEFSLKDDNLGDPLIPEGHIVELNIASYDDIAYLKARALKINSILQDEFSKIGVVLVDFKVEFGRKDGDIILADEISPDSCRLWDIKTSESLDKDLFREGKGNIVEGYRVIAKRLGLI